MAPYTPTYERSKAVVLCTSPGQREVLKPKMASAPSENAGVSRREPSSPTVGRILPKKLWPLTGEATPTLTPALQLSPIRGAEYAWPLIVRAGISSANDISISFFILYDIAS